MARRVKDAIWRDGEQGFGDQVRSEEGIGDRPPPDPPFPAFEVPQEEEKGEGEVDANADRQRRRKSRHTRLLRPVGG